MSVLSAPGWYQPTRAGPGSPFMKPVCCAASAINRVVAASPVSWAKRNERAMVAFSARPGARKGRRSDPAARDRLDLENAEAIEQAAEGTAGQRRDDKQPELG